MYGRRTTAQVGNEVTAEQETGPRARAKQRQQARVPQTTIDKISKFNFSFRPWIELVMIGMYVFRPDDASVMFLNRIKVFNYL